MEVDIPILHRDKTNSRAIGTEVVGVLLFKNLTLLMLEGRSGFVNPSP